MRARTVLALLGAAVLLAGCGVFVRPSPTAGALTDVVNSLVRRGMTVTDQVAGDPGCRDSALYSNAVRYDVQPPGDTSSYPVYVFGWKSEATFEADKAAFDACVGSYSQSVSEPVTIREHLPWRAYGPGWPDTLGTAVEAALTEAGGQPAPVEPE